MERFNHYARMFEHFSVALATILSLFCVVGAGAYFRRTGKLTVETEQPLLRLTVNLLMPCLIIDRVLKTDVFVINPQNIWLPPLLSFGSVAVAVLAGFAVSLLPTKQNGLENWKQRRTFASCVGNYNYGFIPIPLVMIMFPDDTRILGVLFVQNLGVEIALWTIVLFTMIGKFDRTSWRHVINAPSIAIVVSVLLNQLGYSCLVPAVFHKYVAPCFAFLLQAIHLLGGASIPLSIIVTGMVFSEHFHRSEIMERLTNTLKITLWSSLIRLALMPAIFISLAVWLPCTKEIKQVLVIHGAMGSAIFTMALSKHYGGDPKTAFDTIMSNSLLSILTMPVWIAAGLSWIE